MSGERSCLPRILGAIAIALVTGWLITVALILLAGSRPSLHRADAILVLGAAQYNGRPSPVLKARLDYALDLYRDRWAPYLVVTGGVGSGDTLSEGGVARQYAINHGVPDSVILVDRRGTTSARSMAAAAALMRTKQLKSALLVSDSYHMLRLELLARRNGLTPYRAPTPFSPIDRSPRVRRRYVLRESLVLPFTLVFGGR